MERKDKEAIKRIKQYKEWINNKSRISELEKQGLTLNIYSNSEIRILCAMFLENPIANGKKEIKKV